MSTSTLLKKVRKIEIKTNSKTYFTGNYNEFIESFFEDEGEIPNSRNESKIYGANNLPDNWDTFFKYEEFNKIYWRYEREPYKDYYPEGDEFDGDFKYPNSDEIRFCRGWQKKIIDNTEQLETVKFFKLTDLPVTDGLSTI